MQLNLHISLSLQSRADIPYPGTAPDDHAAPASKAEVQSFHLHRHIFQHVIRA
jgi:hypothetical protein